MRIFCVNVGYGDAFFFEGEEGTCLLDTGSGLQSEYKLGHGRIPVVDFLTQRKITAIDHLIITHIHEDHIGALLDCLDNFQIGKLWLPYPIDQFHLDMNFKDISAFDKQSTKLFLLALQQFTEAIAKCQMQGIAIEQLKVGDELEIVGLKIKTLAAKEETINKFMSFYRELVGCAKREEKIKILEKMDALSNATSLVLKINYGVFNALFCADNVPANWSRNEEFFSLLENVTALKFPHHAQADAIDELFMSKMPLELCITTASADQRYDSAATVVYESVSKWATAENRKIKFLFTDPMPNNPYSDEKEIYSAIVLELTKNSQLNSSVKYSFL